MKNMKKFLCVFVAVTLILCSGMVSVFASEANEAQDLELVDVFFNGELMEFDVPAQIINDRTMVPLRKIFETLGATVQWEQDTSTILSVAGETSIIMQIDNKTIFINGEAQVLDVAPMLVGDRTLVPLRAVSEGFGANVEWNEETQTVTITLADETTEEKSSESQSTGSKPAGNKTDEKSSEEKPSDNNDDSKIQMVYDEETGITTIIIGNSTEEDSEE